MKKNTKSVHKHNVLRAKLKDEVRKEVLQEIEAEKKKVKVNIIESEAGWGARVDETLTFDTLELAEAYCKKYNQQNVDNWNKTHSVPSWYMRAEIVRSNY